MSRLRYVVLRHEGVERPHFDLMFETSAGSALATWRSERWPIVGKQRIVRLKDHRRAYLEYEGELSGGRGSVQRVEAGECEIDSSPQRWVIRMMAGSGRALVVDRCEGGDEWVAEGGG